MVKEALKWGIIAVVVLIAWRYLSGALAGILGGGGNSGPVGPIPAPSQFYYQGVYGPIAIPQGDPFYSSPMGWGGYGGRGSRPRPGG
jgi:hypothetical protein